MPATNKQELRRQVRSLFPGEKEREAQSSALCRHVLAWDAYASARVVGGYMPMAHEADVTAILLDALARGKVLALPRCGKPPEMTFHRVSSLEELVSGAYGLKEPSADAPVIAPEEIDLLLVPLEALAPNGLRLGKGGGYYDRFLLEYRGVSLGAALRHQWLATLTGETWDQPLQAAADEEGIHLF